jgi:hypothetical protein
VNGFRRHLGLRYKYVSDEDLLISMHKERSKSSYIPQAAQVESQYWLNENANLVKQLVRQKHSRKS